MDVLKNINSYLGDYDNVIGSLGIVIAIIGLFVGGTGIKLMNRCKIKKSKIEKSQFATTIVNNGANYKEIKDISSEVTNDKIARITKIQEVENLINKDNRYCILLSWVGTQAEYDELVQKGETIKALYTIID